MSDIDLATLILAFILYVGGHIIDLKFNVDQVKVSFIFGSAVGMIASVTARYLF